jgi:ketosteroid isomerase-like protein
MAHTGDNAGVPIDLVTLGQQSTAALRDRGVDAWLDEFCTEDIVWVGFDTFDGRAAVAERLKLWIAAYETWSFELEEIRDCGNGLAFAIFNQTGTLPGVETAVSQRQAQVITLRDGRFAQIVNYLDIEAARSDALAGQPGLNQA